ncbi:MAG: ATP-binding protein [Cytophagia bacterium]|nr:MAG: ATP-binding protein [Cytophagia bacterium]
MENISFTIDAGLINRLGLELVGRVETAVSELIKNAYDADSTFVELNFIDTNEIGGSLFITDDGLGMTENQLINGFMRISSTNKVENPISPIFKRSRAGRKGIGRFATQRLGERLVLVTQIKDSEKALEVTIEWNDYEANRDLTSIKHTIREIPKERVQGTTLKIEKLREKWSEADIKRIFRYTSELIQPNYLSSTAKELRSVNDTFEFKFYQTFNNQKTTIVDTQDIIFNFAIATIEGYIGTDKIGYCSVVSKRFEIDELFEIGADGTDNKIKTDSIIPFNLTQSVHFKAHYFIYNRPDYYDSSIPKMILKQIKDFGDNKSGIRLYRNGFRVLPYGEIGNDWLDIDRIGSDSVTKDMIKTPFENKNLFGFVEIVDREGKKFEETASREGLFNNESFNELKNFVTKSLVKARQTISSADAFKKAKEARNRKIEDSRTSEEKFGDLSRELANIKDGLNNNIDKNQINKTIDNAQNILTLINEDVNEKIEQLAMMRILAGLGITIGEFVHELQQFIPSFNGHITYIKRNTLDSDIKNNVTELEESFSRFCTYTSYFDETISRNVSRQLEPINIRDVSKEFIDTIRADAKQSNIDITIDINNIDLLTCAMHPSEWSAIFFNFYTNSKKSMRKINKIGKKILISAYEELNKICIEFSDNGGGIKDEYKEKIFDAFFTTSQPVSSVINSDLTGTGLGLKIVKDIIDAYNGSIYVSVPLPNYTTTIKIELPKYKSK